MIRNAVQHCENLCNSLLLNYKESGVPGAGRFVAEGLQERSRFCKTVLLIRRRVHLFLRKDSGVEIDTTFGVASARGYLMPKRG